MKESRTSQRMMVLLALAWLLPVAAQDFTKPSFLTLPTSGARPFGLNLGPIFDPTASIIERVSRVHWLGNDLPAEDIISLFEFLAKTPDAKDTNIAGLHFLKNEIWNLLRNQNVAPANFTRTTIGILEDDRQDTVTRDYAIQHLASWCEQGAADAPDAKVRIQAAFIQTTRQNSTLAATALLALQHLSELPLAETLRWDDSFDSLGDAALKMAASDTASVVMRVTAIQICALRGRKEVLPTVETLAEAAGKPALQISAIAALGRLGEPKDVILLQRLEATNNEEIRPAINAALKQLDQTLASRGSFNQQVP